MLTDDREVFERISGDPDTNPEIDFLTFSIYAFEKFQWMEHFKANSGQYPSNEDTARWISELTDFRFSVFREEAARLFDLSARKYLQDEIENEKEMAVRNSILNEVRAAGSVWRQTGIALLTAILAPLIIGVVIVAALSYDRMMYNITDVTHQLQQPPAEKP